MTRVCALCQTRQPVSELGPWGTALACTDIGACEQRAADAHLYPEIEDEESIAAAMLAQGAVPRSSDSEAALIRAETAGDRRAAELAGATEASP